MRPGLLSRKPLYDIGQAPHLRPQDHRLERTSVQAKALTLIDHEMHAFYV